MLSELFGQPNRSSTSPDPRGCGKRTCCSPPGSSVHGILQPRTLEFPSPGDLPDPGIKPMSPSLQADSLPLSHQERSVCWKTWQLLLDFTLPFNINGQKWVSRLYLSNIEVSKGFCLSCLGPQLHNCSYEVGGFRLISLMEPHSQSRERIVPSRRSRSIAIRRRKKPD